ncbi:MAG: hypothetical protein AAF840_06600 [Bacteroidota bacterium]
MELGPQTLAVFQELAAELRRYNNNQEERNKPEAEYLLPDEAAQLVGINVTKSGHHRTRLTRVYKRGLLPRTIYAKPCRYHRKDILQLREKIVRGEAYI